ncbi:hypothetical protein ABEB36_013007 [Hypothenemus hampei]|uniref:Intraflagellar transport protein 46 homolog n=1 Tax=Hypothenemus hampei TaxID=57062 RepID=A0ABD1E6T5_HYPHA
MQRSFSIVEDENDILGEETSEKLELKAEFSDSDVEDASNLSPKKAVNVHRKQELLPRRKPSIESLNTKPLNKVSNSNSDSESSDQEKRSAQTLPGEYDPNLYSNLPVDRDIFEIFEFISKYTPSKITPEYKFKPFIPEFLPAVGDVDAFLKVKPPEKTLSGDSFDESNLGLGLLVLDEPAANQSDPALLHLQLRAATHDPIITQEQRHIVVKKVDNLEKNAKVVEKWIKDVSHLHKSKSSPFVSYSQPMPDIDDLMQQWPDDLELKYKREGFPKPKENQSLSDYVNTVCEYFGIPIAKNQIESLHHLFCLYTAVKQSQVYQVGRNTGQDKEEDTNTDQLVLD